jgi:hypothetical protein
MTSLRRWAVLLTALAPWAVCGYLGLTNSPILLGSGVCLSVVILFLCASVSFDAAPVAQESAPAAVLPTTPVAVMTEAQKQAVISRLKNTIARLQQSRSDTELSAMKLGESIKRVDQMRRAQLDFFATQIAPRLSKAASIPETLRSLDAQQAAEVQRIVVLLQFHDSWEQALGKIEKEELRAALGVLEPNVMQPEQTLNGPTGATMTTVTPVKRTQVELF